MTALNAFIGAPDGGREQTVWTPEFILDRVDCVFPDGWGDPFPSGYHVTYLKPFPFLDSKTGQPYRSGKANAITQFPENLVIVYFGDSRVAEFREAFEDVSTHFQARF